MRFAAGDLAEGVTCRELAGRRAGDVDVELSLRDHVRAVADLACRMTVSPAPHWTGRRFIARRSSVAGANGTANAEGSILRNPTTATASALTLS